MEAAGAILLVCLGVSVLVIGCCAALIVARTRIAPHADCKRLNDALAISIDELQEKFKHRQKMSAARIKHLAKETEPEEVEVKAPTAASDDAFLELRKAHAMKRRLG